MPRTKFADADAAVVTAQPAYMTPGELAAARAALALTLERFADLLHLTRYELAELEAGARAIPADMAYEVRRALATHARERLAESCDLPACDERTRLAGRVARAHGKLVERGLFLDPDEEPQDFNVRYTTEALAGHEKGCVTCRARAAWVERHAPPMPEPPAFLFELPARGAMAPLAWLARRLPRVLHPVPGEAGKFRRAAPVWALCIAAVASFLMLGDVAGDLLDGRVLATLRGVAMLGLLPPMAIVGCSVAGAIADAARVRRHRLSGHLLRYGVLTSYLVAATLSYSAVVAGFGWRGAWRALAVAALTAAVGGTIGALAWLVRRWRGRLPAPLAR